MEVAMQSMDATGLLLSDTIDPGTIQKTLRKCSADRILMRRIRAIVDEKDVRGRITHRW